MRELLAQAGVTLAEGATVRPVATSEPLDFWLWPDSEPFFLHLWPAIQTEWRTGMAGPIGLDKAGVDWHIKRMGWRRRKAAEAKRAVIVMERAALSAWAKQRKRQAQKSSGKAQ